MLSRTRFKKIEQQIALNKELEDKKKYKYVFSNYEEFEEARKQGLIDPNRQLGQPSTLILDI